MRNIVQIDFNDMNNCGVLNSASSESSILLCITPEARQKTSLKVEITGSNGEVLTSPELMAAGGMVRYEADREYWTEAGTMKVRVLSGEGDSGYAEFQIIENMSGGNVQVKQTNRSELVFEVTVNGKENNEIIFEEGIFNGRPYMVTKYPNGKMTLDQVVYVTFYATHQWGTLYESPVVSMGKFAVPFAEKPIIQVTVNSSVGAIIECTCDTTVEDIGNIYFDRGTILNPPGYSAILNIHAEGKWK